MAEQEKAAIAGFLQLMDQCLIVQISALDLLIPGLAFSVGICSESWPPVVDPKTSSPSRYPAGRGIAGAERELGALRIA